MSYSRAGVVLLCLIVLASPPLSPLAATQETPLIDRFVGSWEGHGTLFGTEAQFEMKWEWVLGDRFVHLSFRNAIPGPEGQDRVLEAQAFYRPIGDGRFEGTWFDTRGVVQPLECSSEDGTFTALWGTPETEQGRTVYRLVDADHIEVEDHVLSDGEWRQFGHAVYTRSS